MRFLATAQGRGDIRTDQPVNWMGAIVLSLSMVAVTDVLEGRLDAEQAGAMLGETFVAAFAFS